MSQIREITPYTHARLSEKDEKWLTRLSERIDAGQPLALRSAEQLFRRRAEIAITGSSRRSVIRPLMQSYGIEETGILEDQNNIAALLKLKDAGINPLLASDEYYSHDWQTELEEYSDPEHPESLARITRFNLSDFVDICKLSVALGFINIPGDRTHKDKPAESTENLLESFVHPMGANRAEIRKFKNVVLAKIDLTERILGKVALVIPNIHPEDAIEILDHFMEFQTSQAIEKKHALSSQAQKALSYGVIIPELKGMHTDTILVPRKPKTR